MTQTIYHIALFTAIFASGMLVGYLLKIFITARNAKKTSDLEWEETKRLIAESEENMPTADYVFDKEGAHLILNQKGQPTFKASNDMKKLFTLFLLMLLPTLAMAEGEAHNVSDTL